METGGTDIKKLIWKYRYAKHLKRRLRLEFLECWNSAESALVNLDYDLTECPIYSAEEEYFCWNQQ